MKLLLTAAILTAGVLSAELPRIIYSAQGGKIKSFDPVLADDAGSSRIVGAVYDTLLQYSYAGRPYRLEPAMLAEMPVFSSDFRSCRFRLRQDLYFAADPVFPDRRSRHITADDVFYSLKRLCDPRKNSPVYWIMRNKISGMELFRQAASRTPDGDLTPYDLPLPGFVRHNAYEFTIKFTSAQPRFLYLLAMSNTAIVSRQAEKFYGSKLSRRPVGSGPFMVKYYRQDYKLHLVRNPDFRKEYFDLAENAADRKRPLPLADEIIIYTIKQPVTAWLMFLQGKLDFNALSKDEADLISGGQLPAALKKRGVRLLRAPVFEVRYIGFNFNDPLLGKNRKLRQALSLAYNVQKRIEHTNHQLLRAHSPIPPGVAGHDPAWRNPYSADNLPLAKKLLTEAGFPGGIDPATGKPLRLTLDLQADSSMNRQIAEMTVREFRQLGIELEAVFNFKPRFFQRLRQNRSQLFRLSWVGDYPDAENFLQLFCSWNRSSCNRTGFSSPEFDRIYRRIAATPPGAEREKLCRQAVKLLCHEAPWILEGYPVSYQLLNPWLENFLPHDFEYTRLKYLSVDPGARKKLKSTFIPLSFSDLH